MREVDRLTTERYGIPSIILMENAAHAVARVITEKLGGSVKGKSILILCGKGNNGGDGAALARILIQAGAGVEIILFGKFEELSGDASINFSILRSLVGGIANVQNRFGGAWFSLSEIGPLYLTYCATEREWLKNKQFEERFERADLVVDAMLGTGIKRSLEGLFDLVVRYISQQFFSFEFPPIISVDMPTGLDADLGFPIGSYVVAETTVTFGAAKVANVVPTAARSNGLLVIADIGIPGELFDEQPSRLYLVEKSDATDWLSRSRFSDSSYKNKRGHALVIAGSETYSGAAVLSGNSAMRSGVGLVTLACPKDSKTEIASRLLPEVILATIGSSELDELSPKANVIAIGPGLSATDPNIEKLVKGLIAERTRPTIVDAGALWFLNPPDGIPQVEGVPLILTPHEGEFMRLLGTDDKSVIEDRVAAVRNFSQENNVILVLKGERVLIGEPGGKVVVNPTGNSGLGKAGNGDTLTGILAGFVAQAAAMEIDIFETVVAAVYIAGLAGDIAEKKYGKRVMTASDVRECMPEAFSELATEN